MKNIFPVILWVLLSFFACKSSKNITNNSQKPENIVPIQINIPSSIEQGQNLNINISTDLSEGILLFDPMLVRIEKYDSDQWRQLKILHCPCGAYCEPPPKVKKLLKNEIWTLNWNLKETWCKKTKDQKIPKTIENPAEPGKYRVVIFYGHDENNRIKQTKEFQII